MKKLKTKITASVVLVLAAAILFSSLPLYAAANAIDNLMLQTPKMTMEVEDFHNILEFYQNASTSVILSDYENNYTYDYVPVNGKNQLCHVYMRAFSVTGVQNYTIAEVHQHTEMLFKAISRALSAKYIKCVAVHYAFAVSGRKNQDQNRYDSLTIRFFICTNESNEERNSVINTFVMPAVYSWRSLSENDKLISLNEFMLDGKFKYDVTYQNRSSVAQFIADGKGVCEEYAALLSLFLDALGYENKIICGTAGNMPHVWNLVKIFDRWYNYDVLWNGPIDSEGNHISVEMDYLLISTEKIKQTHTPDPYFEGILQYAVYDYYFGEPPEDIDMLEYEKQGNYILAKPETTCSEFLSFSLQPKFIELYADGVLLSGSDYIGTGTRAVLQVNGVEIISYDIVIPGELSGDGSVNSADFALLKNHLLETGRLVPQTPACAAADLNKDGAVTITDLLMLHALLKG